MGDIVNFILDLVGDMGYIGIFIMMFLESTFFPFPSEVAMIPAGYLASKGEMSIYICNLKGNSWSLVGAIFIYIWVKRVLGKKIAGIYNFGKEYFLHLGEENGNCRGLRLKKGIGNRKVS